MGIEALNLRADLLGDPRFRSRNQLVIPEHAKQLPEGRSYHMPRALPPPRTRAGRKVNGQETMNERFVNSRSPMAPHSQPSLEVRDPCGIGVNGGGSVTATPQVGDARHSSFADDLERPRRMTA